jgi:hypothetical protein
LDNGSRVNLEVYARFCERLGVKSPGLAYLFVTLRANLTCCDVQSTSTASNSAFWAATIVLADRPCCLTPSSILLQNRRENAAAKRFFKRVLGSNPVPHKIVTDQMRSYRRRKATPRNNSK